MTGQHNREEPDGNSPRLEDEVLRASPRDHGLRRVLIWTLIALVVSVVMAVVGAALAVRWFDRP